VLAGRADFSAVIRDVAGAVWQPWLDKGCALTTRLPYPDRGRTKAVAIAQATMERIPLGDPQDPANLMGP